MNKNISKKSLGVRSMLERLFGRRLLKQTFSQKIVSQKANRRQLNRVKLLLALSLMVAVVTGLSMQALKQNRVVAYEDNEFVTRWTDLASGNFEIKLHGSDNNFDIDWGDGATEIIKNKSIIKHHYNNLPLNNKIDIKIIVKKG